MVFKGNYHLLILAAIVIVVFLGSLILTREGNIYISPDETANAFFSRQFAKTGSFASFDILNKELNDSLVPRSMVSINGSLLPGSFIGLPFLYGVISKVLGTGILEMLTPLFAVAAVFAWYRLMKHWFDSRIALISSILLATHPAWWYYSARSLMHNVLFVSFLVFAAFVFFTRPFQKKIRPEIGIVVSGVLLGTALFVRPSEIVWIILVILLVVYLSKIKINKYSIFIFIASVAAALMPMVALNQAAYGSFFSTGYTVEDDVGVVSSIESDGSQVRDESRVRSGSGPYDRFQESIKFIFPFGLHPRNVLRHVLWYGVSLFWWLSVLVIIGIPLFFKEKKKKTYFITFFFISSWLALMYGPWVFHDNPDPLRITIANSYVRYWLPIFVLMTPFAAAAILWLSDRTKTVFAKYLSIIFLVLLVFGLNVNAVFFASEDSLVPAADVLNQSMLIRNGVLDLTESDSVIIVDRADKIFFPYRRIRQPLRDETTYNLMPKIVENAPLYYFGITFPEQDIEYLNEEKLKGFDLQIRHVKTFGEESLYEIY